MDIDDFLTLFINNTLTLSSDISISPPLRTIIEQVVDDALGKQLAALPGSQAVQITNRDTVMTEQLISITYTDGVLLIFPYQLQLLSFNDIVDKIGDDISPFELFMADFISYRIKLTAWRNIQASWIERYCKWLKKRNYREEQIQKTLNAVAFYCRLAMLNDYLPSDEYDEIVRIIERLQ